MERAFFELENAVVLGLRQGGIDNGSPNLPVSSVGDVLRAVLASEGLHELLHAELLANLEKVHILTTDTAFSPEVKWYYEYRSLSYNAPRLSVSLRNGALLVNVELDKLRVNAELFRDGKVFSSHRDFNTVIENVDARFELKLAFKNGRIEVEASAEPDGIELSDPNFEGEGIIGEAIEFAADSFGAGPARKALQKALKKGIEKNLPTALERLLNNAVGAGLATHVDVPNIGRPGNTRLTFDANLGGLSVRSGGMLRVDFDTTVTGPATKTVNTLVAAPATKTLPEHFTALAGEECRFECKGFPHQCLPEFEEAQRCLAKFKSESAGGISPALVGQALHALWRANYFNFDNAGPALGLNLSGIGQLDLDMLMPPAVFGTTNGVRVFVGPVATRIVRTGQPTLEGQLYARIDVPVVLSGDRSIAFGTPNVANVGFDPRGISGPIAFVLPPIVESAVEAVLQASLRRALAGVDPIALPAYRVPASLSTFGLPANAEFGVKPGRIEGSEGFLTLIGRVGEL